VSRQKGYGIKVTAFRHMHSTCLATQLQGMFTVL